MKKIAILLEDLVEEVEFIYPYYRLKEEGFEVEILAPQIRTYQGKKGMPISANKKLDIDYVGGYDGVFIPGGYAPDKLRRDRDVVLFVQTLYKQGKLVAAICHAPWVLITAKIIEGKKVTGFYSIKDDIQNAGAIYTGNAVEVDGNLITATDPSAMPEMMKQVIKFLKEN